MPISRRKQTPYPSWPIVVLVLFVMIGTWFAMVVPEPEAHSIASSDGAVRIDGIWPSGAEPNIVRRDELNGPFTAVQGFVYTVSGSPAPDGSPYHLTFSLPPSLGASRATLLNYDSELAAWRPIPSTLGVDRWSLVVEMPRLPGGLWAVGMVPSLPASANIDFSTLTDVPPPGAVGYRAFSAASTVSDDFVLDGALSDQGGCEGQFIVGSHRTKTSLDLRLAGGIRRLIVEWQLGDGCAPGQQILSSTRVSS